MTHNDLIIPNNKIMFYLIQCMYFNVLKAVIICFERMLKKNKVVVIFKFILSTAIRLGNWNKKQENLLFVLISCFDWVSEQVLLISNSDATNCVKTLTFFIRFRRNHFCLEIKKVVKSNPFIFPIGRSVILSHKTVFQLSHLI
jgi:hypothetical protein